MKIRKGFIQQELCPARNEKITTKITKYAYLLGKPTDAFDQILIRCGVVGDQLSHLGNDVEGELVVRVAQHRVLHVAELQD
jgi:hypothetical protein